MKRDTTTIISTLQILQKNITYEATISSNSMHPYITQGDIITICSLPLSSVHVGDIIVYNSPQSHLLVAHRVILIGHTKTGPYLVTKGDHNTTQDYVRITKEAYVGTVCKIKPTLRSLLNKFLLKIGF